MLLNSFLRMKTIWTTDVLPYRQYREYMSKYLLIFYQSNVEWRNQLIKAIDRADGNDYSIPNTSNDNHGDSYGWNYPYGTPSWCSCCPPSSLTNTKEFQINDSKSITAVIIVTTRNASSSSFLSFLYNCLTPFPHRSIHYIDEPINESFPSTISTIIYLFCFDHDDPTLQQTLDRTILNNLNVHRNYFFLLFNSPSQTLINHLYETVMDKRLILILHYHSSPSLLCSGDRQTFEYLQESFFEMSLSTSEIH